MRSSLITAAALALTALLAACQSAPDELPDACYQKPESGMCRAAFQRYYYDEDTGTCKSFIWGGCKGSVPFETLDDCTRSCDALAAPHADESSLRKVAQ
ncbi:proteinase inhibitor I2 Kunitz metazoa [Alcanivorax hongdengensis A-11-3]|uniref:Proteinase inhibitor I2 Kunitz metazoa n=1 Tax=Alcanivorax hongdengensis A-11-3 TaxID=1177179 RepID=L0WES7_9GAMM|nr:BPTI/Kunitz domain-containing protein [Alcanivorax hongdengensis]EKF75521.1 proteinase inhibitor I2 Kunitz metazoa [Alcanivorax hongdengensis A-11-3]